ncbi:hypothetical protein L6164_009770 [Bauhinia variegata]|uniref:Uncharacterized protein n=1 Tax=Bauhinia variegata TaxID=167791 RepID=A0ACB9PK54_BAUVA|nr:hypothetical protein L6164_009770 [Bauhinia variegata]
MAYIQPPPKNNRNLCAGWCWWPDAITRSLDHLCRSLLQCVKFLAIGSEPGSADSLFVSLFSFRDKVISSAKLPRVVRCTNCTREG